MTDNEFKKWHSRKTWRSFFYSLIGVTLPFFLSLICIIMIRKYEFIISFVDDGQFLLFSVGLLTSAFYIFREDENQKEIRDLTLTIRGKSFRLENLGDFIMFFLLFSSVIYALLYTFTLIDISFLPVNIWFVRIASLLIFGFSLFSIFKGIQVDYYNKSPKVDIQKESKKGVDDILQQL